MFLNCFKNSNFTLFNARFVFKATKGPGKVAADRPAGEENLKIPSEQQKRTKRVKEMSSRAREVIHGKLAHLPSSSEKRNLRKQAEVLTESISAYGRYILERLRRTRDGQMEEFEWLMTEAERDPSRLWFPDFDDIKDSWPDRAFFEYEQAYDHADEYSTNKTRAEAIEAFDHLRNTIKDYFNEAKKVIGILEKKYESKVAKLLSAYDLPKGVDVTNLHEREIIIDTLGDISGGGLSSVYKTQKNKIKLSHLREREKIDSFYADYFKRMPTKKFDNWDELVKNLTSFEHFEKYFSGFSQNAILKQVNEIILLRNMYTVNEESKNLKNDFYTDVSVAMERLNESYDEYYSEDRDKGSLIASK